MPDLKLQGVVEMSAEGAESALDRVGEKAGQMAERLQREGQKAGAAVDGIGSGADKSAEQFSRAESKIAASIKRATTNFEMLGKTASEKLEFQIGQKGLDASKFEPMLAKLRELEAANARVGLSTGQMTQALRSVPAQMTDVVVSLASGQQPMTVLLQQGGQLKDMFGGVGAAVKAVGGYIASMVNPLTVAAAAIGGVGYAFYAGSKESDEFRKNLILTGNASGLTVDRFNAMAKAMSNVAGITQGGAAEALTAMAASGNITTDSIQRLTATALQLERVGGPAVADTVKQFEALGKEPLKASVELSDKTHYLTLAVYEQIKALEEQGKTSEAAAVAQNAWADALDQRTPQMVQNIGLLESAWREMAGTAAMAWDTLKGIGRDDSTTEDKIARLQTRLAQAKIDLATPDRARFAESVTLLENEIADLEKRTDKAVAKRAADQEREKQRIAANSGVDKLIESQRSKREQYSAELKKLDAQRTGDLISEEKYQQAKSALAKKYEEKPKAVKADKVENAYNSILDSLNKQLGAAEKLNAVEKLNVELQEKKYAKFSPLQKENLRLIAEQIDAQKRAEVEGKATLDWITKGADDQKKAVKALNDEIEKTAREIATYGMSRSEIAAYDLRLLDEQIQAERDLNAEIGVGGSQQLKLLEQQRESRQQILDKARQLDRLDAGKKAAEDAAKAAAKVEAEWIKAIDRIDQAFHDGFVKAIEASGNSFEAFTDSMRTSLKAAIADGLYQLTMKPLVVSVMTSFAGAASAATSANGEAPAASLSNGFGVITGLQSLWGGINGGVANAANSFAMSGMGQAAGLSTTAAMGPPTAAGAMGGPTAVLTGAGATFAAAAAPVLGSLAAAYAIAEMQKSGWGIDNDKKSAAMAAVSVGTLGANVILDRLFGHNRNVSNDAQGITGTFDLSGFEGQSYQERSQKGGTFRSDRRWTDYSAIGSDMDKALDSMLKQAVSGVQTISKTLGVEAGNALDGFTHEFRLQLSENGDMSKAGEKIAAEIKKVEDELVTKLVPNIADFARYGESASDTFARLNQEVSATDAILLAMGKNASDAFGAVGLASIAAREDLIDLAGGLDNLASKTQSFYQAYYSSSEQQQLAAKQAQQVLVDGFADIGQSIPANRKAFRDLVEAQDLSTDAGRKLWNSLLDLSDEFDTVQKLADSAAESLKAAKQSQATLFDTFASDAQKLDAAKKLVSDTFSSIGKDVPASAAAFLQLAQSIDPATEAGQSLIATLSGVSNAFSYVQTAAAGAAQAANQAQSSQRGLLDRYDQSGVLDRAQKDIDAAFATFGATFSGNAADLSALLKSIDPTSEAGQKQLAAISGVSSAIDAVFSAQAAAADEAKRAADEAARAAEYAANKAVEDARRAAEEQIRLANQVHDSISSALRSLLGDSEQYQQQTRQMAQATLQSALVIAKAGGSLANFAGLDAALQSIGRLDKSMFSTATDYASEFGRTANLLTQLEQYTRVNGSHADGLEYVPFDGYVAQLHRGERVQTASAARDADSTASEVKALRDDIRAIGAALAATSQRSARLLEKWDIDGQPAVRV